MNIHTKYTNNQEIKFPSTLLRQLSPSWNQDILNNLDVTTSTFSLLDILATVHYSMTSSNINVDCDSIIISRVMSVAKEFGIESVLYKISNEIRKMPMEIFDKFALIDRLDSDEARSQELDLMTRETGKKILGNAEAKRRLQDETLNGIRKIIEGFEAM
ncbi:unnamed protein product [Caenorhabditis angaria]|uniref:Uncharacterized protein n=1 Tax=Caenorhabditis angaria TaxID=860376 RepID=A0A9P1MUV8_9PELO|nr:unnamed protein product [Caenorhabditis angaria]